jgi:hypothetical protein
MKTIRYLLGPQQYLHRDSLLSALYIHTHSPSLFFFALFLLSLSFFVTHRLMAVSKERGRPAGNPFPKRGQIKQRIMKDVVMCLKCLASATSRRGSGDADGQDDAGDGNDDDDGGDDSGSGSNEDVGGSSEGGLLLNSASSREMLLSSASSGLKELFVNWFQVVDLQQSTC